MLFPEKTILLKDSRTALLRAPRPREDAQAMIDYLAALSRETDFVLRNPEECNDTLEQEQAFLQACCDSEASCMIVCEVEGEVAGNCQLKLNTRMKVRHRAEVAIGLTQKFWGLGIGTALFEEMIALAHERGVEQLELTHVEGNDRAHGLYEKMGFHTAAVLPDAFRLRDGSSRGEVIMLRRL